MLPSAWTTTSGTEDRVATGLMNPPSVVTSSSSAASAGEGTSDGAADGMPVGDGVPGLVAAVGGGVADDGLGVLVEHAATATSDRIAAASGRDGMRDEDT